MSIYDELLLLSHDDLVQLSSLVYRLLRWDSRMSWDEALQQAYDRVIEERDWFTGNRAMLNRCC